ncbi:hypothetical protein FPZ12_000120 [Amycolatopsis acidicola]|uniref:Uncharacterized protein n=1 Tax=Amycolatopsis acidicola TaxID=2596893 RepID=A0A5N0VK23_9PSEU|nr:hypothetical protein [Amycolatopsis acidicola]KAA9166669.1 hypothetical protein FPZ12_000120 [Amycolatopsis acidicola]
MAESVPIGNVIVYLAISAVPPVFFWLMLKIPALADAALRRRRRPPLTSAPPIEQLAADLRRVHRALATLAPDAPVVRRRATRQAYDALLIQACQAIGEPHWLDEVPEGVEREVERLRIEEKLRSSGLAVP